MLRLKLLGHWLFEQNVHLSQALPLPPDDLQRVPPTISRGFHKPELSYLWPS